MSLVGSKNYINIQGWMVSEIGLSGNELLVYAIIYGFSQDGEGEFTGSLRYLMDWTGASKNTVMRALVSLEEKGLISKQKITTNGVALCKYKAISDLNGGCQNGTGGGAKIEPNNKDNNLVITPLNPPEGKCVDDIAEIVDYLNAKTGSSFKASTASTRKQIGARLKDGYTVDDCKRVIDDRVKLWKGTEWAQYLRPDTLFRPSKFEGYLNAAPKDKPPDDWRKDYKFYEGQQ